MWEEILKLAVGNGLWAVLFCVLLFYLIKDSKHREEKYVQLISSLSDKLKIVYAVKEEVEKIKDNTEKLVKAAKLKNKPAGLCELTDKQPVLSAS